MPGNAGDGMPVTLKVRSEERKRVIGVNLEREVGEHVDMVSL